MPVRAIRSSTAGRLIVELAQQRSFRVGECQLGRMTDRRLLGIGANLLDQGPKLFEDVVDRLDQPGTVADQAMAAAAGEAVGGPGDGEDLAILFHGVPAVESDPLRGVASTTTTPSDSPEMIRFAG